MVTLVLLPGMDGTGKLFADFRAAVDGNIDLTVISYPANRVLNYSQLADFVARRLPHNEPFVLLGESFSGPVAIELAASRPAGLAGIVLCCSFARNPVPLLAPLRSLIGLLPRAGTLARFAAPLLFGRFSTKQLRDPLAAALRDVSSEVLKARLRAVFDADFSGRLKDIDVPVLYVQATEDRIVPTSAMQHIRSRMPSLRVARVRGPHSLLQVMPVESAKIIGSFVMTAASERNREK